MDDLLRKKIEENYNFKILNSKDIYSYGGGVSEIITDNGQIYVFKYLENVTDKKLLHHQAIIKFCGVVDKNITEFTTQKLIKNKKGETLTYLWDKDYCYIVEKKKLFENVNQQLMNNLT